MSQLKKPHILYHNFTFALLLLLFAFLSHIALGILDNYLANALSILALGLLLFTLRKHSNKLFLIALTFLFAIAFSYIPSGILYGPASIGVIASVYETNFSETLGFLRAMPSSIYIFILVYFLLFIILLFVNRHITPNKNNTSKYYFIYFIILVFSLYQPVSKEITNTDKEKEFSIADFFKASDFYPVSFIANTLKVNHTYLTQRDLLNDALTKTPEWNILSVEPKYQNYVLIIGESMRRC